MVERGNPSKDYVGVPIPVDGILFDISDCKQAEEEMLLACQKLGDEKNFLQSIVNNIESGILVTDLNQRIIFANPYAYEFFSNVKEEVVNSYLRDIWPELIEQIAAGNDSGEITINTTRCEQLVIGFSRFNLKSVDQEIIGNIINFKDLAEVVAIRREMSKKDRLSVMGEVVARVAHEMRNPLFGMTAVGQILDMELQLNPAHQQLMDCFQKEARRLKTLVDDLLECTRELRLRRQKVNLLKIIDAAIYVNEIFTREKMIEITRPNTDAQDLWVWADADKLEQILVNLLKNAIDASFFGGTICFMAMHNSGAMFITVADMGSGIPEELTEKIFEVFYTTKTNGTGLGLAISRNIAVAHGGSLTVCNNEDGGATFTVTLPLREKNT